MATAEGVCSAESDDFLVVEAHAVEDLYHGSIWVRHGRRGPYMSEMVSTLGGVWETTVRGDVMLKPVNSAGSPGDLGASHFLSQGIRPRIKVR